jgi:hypothetical protein
LKINNRSLQQAINDWEETAPIELILDTNALRIHMWSVYGIDLGYPLLRISNVVDEKKFMFFLLKYG